MLRHSFIAIRGLVPMFAVALVAAGIAAPLAATLAADDDPPLSAPRADVPIASSFMYQGRLELDGVPASGEYDLKFLLFDDGIPGAPDMNFAQVELDAVLVTDGLFSVDIDPGAGVFTGAERWIEVSARPEGSSEYVQVGGRQELTPTPYALYAAKGGPHLNEVWTGDRDRGGSLVPQPLFGVTNTNEPTAPGDPSGVAIAGAAGTSGIGVFGRVTQSTTSAPGIDLNSFTGGVVGLDFTFNCQVICVGVKGIATGGISNGQSIGVFGTGATNGVRGVGSNVGVTGEGPNAGVVGAAIGPAAPGVRGEGNVNQASTGVIGESITPNSSDGIGVVGTSGTQPPVRPVNTGVYGYAAASDATGVYGRADGLNAVAVKGVAPTSDEFAGYFVGKVTVSGTLTFPSDARLKHDVATLRYGLDEVLALQPSSYVYNDDDAEAVRLGLIAQDVREVMPELVSEDASSGMLGLNYIDLIPVLVRAIQEQDAEIAGLRGRASVEAADDGAAWEMPVAVAFAGFAMLGPRGAARSEANYSRCGGLSSLDAYQPSGRRSAAARVRDEPAP